MDMGPDGKYFIFGKNGKQYGGLFTRTAKMASVPPFWLDYVGVNDLERSMKTATGSGAKVQNGPMGVPGGRIVVMSDPQGGAFALFQASKQAAWNVAAKPKPKAKAKAAARKKTKSAARK